MIINIYSRKHTKKQAKKNNKFQVFSISIFAFFFFTSVCMSFVLNPLKLYGSGFNTSNFFPNLETISEQNINETFNDVLAESSDYIDITAEAAIIVETDNNRILWQKNSEQEMFPASTTKILTAIVAIERITDLDEVIKIPANASGRNDSFFPFKTGEEVTLGDLLKAALISSHNNATVALAEYISGSEAEFLKLMNAKAIELGAFNTYFQNTNGLDSKFPEHKTTAYDLAIIARYCMNNELFREIVGTKKDAITLGDERIDIYNTNSLLFFEYINGIKTGFTNNAGYCLVTSSSRENLNLIIVALNCEGGKREADILKLINWSNDNYFYKKIIDAGQKYKTIIIQDVQSAENYILKTTRYSDLYPSEDYEKLINSKDKIVITDNLKENITGLQNDSIYVPETPVLLPSEKGITAGTIDIYINDNKENNTDVCLKESIDKTYATVELSKKYDSSVRNTIIVLIAFYFLLFIFIIIKNFIQGRKDGVS